jgi:diaminohydroxyphosphoribosylaminopyrimidine deaminase/5-amino-6-(5-phosphoribosylamino)uracil reductase
MLVQPGATLIATTHAAPDARLLALEQAGAEIVVIPSEEDQRVDLKKLMTHLGARGVVNLLVEGGGSVHGAFFDADLVDKVYAFVAPQIVGGEASRSPVEGAGVAAMADSWILTRTSYEQIGPDWLIIGYPEKQAFDPSSYDEDESLHIEESDDEQALELEK